MVATHFRQYLRDVRKKTHGFGELGTNHLHELAEHVRGDPAFADGECRLDGGEPERLHAIPEDWEVLAFDGGEGGLDIDAFSSERRDQLDEALLARVEPVLAVPQGVVGVERQHVERLHRGRAFATLSPTIRLTPSSSSSSCCASPTFCRIRSTMSVLPST